MGLLLPHAYASVPASVLTCSHLLYVSVPVCSVVALLSSCCCRVVFMLQLYSACFAWALHWLVARLLLKGMNVPGVAWSELLAYTGYPFVLICFTTLGGFLAGVVTCL